MPRSRALTPFLLLLVLLTAAACALFDSPEGGARAFVEAAAARDSAKMAERTCSAQRANASITGTAVLAAVQVVMGIADGLSDAPIRVDTSAVQYTVVSRDGETAAVRAHGPVRADLGFEQPLDVTLPMRQENGRWTVCG